MTSKDIREKEFEISKRRGGYVQEDVDRYLDEVIEAVEASERANADLQTENANLRVRIHDAEMEIRDLRQNAPDDQSETMKKRIKELELRLGKSERENRDLRERADELLQQEQASEAGGKSLCDEIQVQQMVLEHLERARQKVEQQEKDADMYAASVMKESGAFVDEVRNSISETLDELETFRRNLSTVIEEQGSLILQRIDAMEGIQGLMDSLDRGSAELVKKATEYEELEHDARVDEKAARRRTSKSVVRAAGSKASVIEGGAITIEPTRRRKTSGAAKKSTCEVSAEKETGDETDHARED